MYSDDGLSGRSSAIPLPRQGPVTGNGSREDHVTVKVTECQPVAPSGPGLMGPTRIGGWV